MFININDYFTKRMKNDTKTIDALKNFFTDQDFFMRNMIKDYTPDSAFWRHVSYIVAQYDGLVQGYKAHVPTSQASI